MKRRADIGKGRRKLRTSFPGTIHSSAKIFKNLCLIQCYRRTHIKVFMDQLTTFKYCNRQHLHPSNRCIYPIIFTFSKQSFNEPLDFCNRS